MNFGDGLAAISLHAESLGYAGVILFLDELILWFLSRLGDTAWVSDEASKLSKLVEASSASRPVPIVSIIARQRDLRELVGDSVPGAEKLSFADTALLPGGPIRHHPSRRFQPALSSPTAACCTPRSPRPPTCSGVAFAVAVTVANTCGMRYWRKMATTPASPSPIRSRRRS